MRRLPPAERRQSIIEAALAVALKKGLATTTVRDVATEMGTSSGLIHHYFDSMDDVLAAAFELAAGGDLEKTRRAVQAMSTPDRRLDSFITGYSPAQSDPTMQLWLDAWSEASRRPALQAVSRRLNLAWHQLLRSIIDQGVEDQSFACEDSTAAAWRTLSMLDGLALQVVAHPQLVSYDDLVTWSRQAAQLELGRVASP